MTEKHQHGAARPLPEDLQGAEEGRNRGGAAFTPPGTSRSRAPTASPARCSTSVTTPSPSSATRTSATARCPVTPRASTSTASSTIRSTGPGRRHRLLPGSLLPEDGQLRVRAGSFNYDRSNPASLPEQIPGELRDGAVRLHHPDGRLGGEPGAGVLLRAWIVRRRRRGARRQRPRHGERAQLHVLRDRVVGPRGRPQRRPGDRGRRRLRRPGAPEPGAVPEASATGSSRARLNTLYLGRLMPGPPTGSRPIAAFQNTSGNALFDPPHLYYDGNSQGGIMGGGMTIALARPLAAASSG